MKKREITKRAALVAAMAVAAGAFLMQPASAEQVDTSWSGTQAAVDNSPGSGTAWAWVYGSRGAYAISGINEYETWDGENHKLLANSGKTNSESPKSKIKGFRACTVNYIPTGMPPTVTTCGDWTWFG